MAKAKYILKCGKVEMAIGPGYAHSIIKGEDMALEYAHSADKKEMKSLIRARLASIRTCLKAADEAQQQLRGQDRGMVHSTWTSDAIVFLAQAALLQRIVDGGPACYVRLGSFVVMDERPVRFGRPTARIFTRTEAAAFIGADKAGADMQIVEA